MREHFGWGQYPHPSRFACRPPRKGEVKGFPMSLTLITPPAVEPVTLAEAKAHLRIDASDEDVLVSTLITAARARAEWHSGRAFVTQSWLLKLDQIPRDGIITLPLPPLQSVTSLAVTTTDNIRSIIDPSRYSVDLTGARVIFADQPQHLRRYDCIEIAYTAGYGNAAAVPTAIREAILQIIADLYAHRGDETTIVSKAGQVLLAPYRLFKL